MIDNDNIIFLDGYILDMIEVNDSLVYINLITYEFDVSKGTQIPNQHKLVFKDHLASLASEYLESNKAIGISGSIKHYEDEEKDDEIIVNKLFFGTQNVIKIVGYVGKIDVKKNNVVRLRVATHDFYKSKGEKVEETDWHTIVAFNHAAEVIKECIEVGDLISVKGKVKTKEFNKNIRTEIYAESIKLKKKKGENNEK